MNYENRQVPEPINYTDEHPLKDFLWLLGAVALLIAALLLVVHLCAKLLAPFIPFEYESKISEPFVQALKSDSYRSEEQQKIQTYLEDFT